MVDYVGRITSPTSRRIIYYVYSWGVLDWDGEHCSISDCDIRGLGYNSCGISGYGIFPVLMERNTYNKHYLVMMLWLAFYNIILLDLFPPLQMETATTKTRTKLNVSSTSTATNDDNEVTGMFNFSKWRFKKPAYLKYMYYYQIYINGLFVILVIIIIR